MTRINLILPQELTDQHLLAEFKEIKQLCGSLIKTLNSKTGLIKSKIPKEFTLNKGHVYFFFNKGFYLHKRFDLIKEELLKRGFKATSVFPKEYWPEDLYQDWHPDEKAIEIIKERINSKLQIKPHWYKYYGKPLSS